MEQLSFDMVPGRVDEDWRQQAKRAKWRVVPSKATWLFESKEAARAWGWRQAPTGLGPPRFDYVEAFPMPRATTCGQYALIYKGRENGRQPATFAVTTEGTLEEATWLRTQA